MGDEELIKGQKHQIETLTADNKTLKNEIILLLKNINKRRDLERVTLLKHTDVEFENSYSESNVTCDGNSNNVENNIENLSSETKSLEEELILQSQNNNK